MTDPHDGHQEIHLPSPSVWPAVLGAGMSMAAFGIATSALFVVFGVALVVWGLFGWIQDVRHG
jgi:hypothetical protein